MKSMSAAPVGRAGVRLAAFGMAAMSLVTCLADTAMADPMSIHGMWGGRTSTAGKAGKSGGFSLFSGPSFLGASPAKAAAYRPYKIKPAPQLAAPLELAEGGAQPDIKGEEPALVRIKSSEFSAEYGPGSIVVDTARRRLYYILLPDLAYEYPIAVGKEGFAWTGTETVSKVVQWPEWVPPEEMRVRNPTLPIRMTGGVNNPLGARAIYLGQSLYRIHGTNDPGSIGSASSSGCFRMHNRHVAHLAALVTAKRTKVHVLNRVAKGAFTSWKPQQETPTDNPRAKRTKSVKSEVHHI